MTTKEFIQYASERPELCDKISACTAPEEAYEIARGEGLTDDLDTFKKVMTETKAEMEKLSEADLESVSAALNTDALTITVGITTIAVPAAAFAAV